MHAADNEFPGLVVSNAESVTQARTVTVASTRQLLRLSRHKQNSLAAKSLEDFDILLVYHSTD